MATFKRALADEGSRVSRLAGSQGEAVVEMRQRMAELAGNVGDAGLNLTRSVGELERRLGELVGEASSIQEGEEEGEEDLGGRVTALENVTRDQRAETFDLRQCPVGANFNKLVNR